MQTLQCRSSCNHVGSGAGRQPHIRSLSLQAHVASRCAIQGARANSWGQYLSSQLRRSFLYSTIISQLDSMDSGNLTVGLNDAFKRSPHLLCPGLTPLLEMLRRITPSIHSSVYLLIPRHKPTHLEWSTEYSLASPRCSSILDQFDRVESLECLLEVSKAMRRWQRTYSSVKLLVVAANSQLA